MGYLLLLIAAYTIGKLTVETVQGGISETKVKKWKKEIMGQ